MRTGFWEWGITAGFTDWEEKRKMDQLILWVNCWDDVDRCAQWLSCVCVWLCDPMDCSPPGSAVHGILQARILEWFAMPSCRASSQPRNEPTYPALKVDSLLSEPSEKPMSMLIGKGRKRVKWHLSAPFFNHLLFWLKKTNREPAGKGKANFSITK